MLMLPSSVKIFLSPVACDMRRGFDGLSAQVKDSGFDVFDGHLFVFLSKKFDRCKILTWHSGGFVLWYKRLEKGRFKKPTIANDGSFSRMDAASLALVVEGIDGRNLARPKLWTPKSREKDRHALNFVIKGGHGSQSPSVADRRVASDQQIVAGDVVQLECDAEHAARTA